MRYPIRIHDADELGWMDARGDLYRELCARRRARAYALALQRFRCVPIGSTRDARPNGAATDKQEMLVVGSGAAERCVEQMTLEAIT